VIEILNAVGAVLHDAWLGLLIGVLIFGPAIMFVGAVYWSFLVSQYLTSRGDE
jgi:hypothetical protein